MTTDDRLTRLESECRRLRIAVVLLAVLVVATMTTLHPRAQQAPGVLRARGLIIEDDAGRPRVVLGAPIPEQRSTTRTGLKILDASGVERLGMNLLSNGSMVLGLDAPAGTGNDANKERITLVADDKGGAAMTFKIAARSSLAECIWIQRTVHGCSSATLRRSRRACGASACPVTSRPRRADVYGEAVMALQS
jgi:hypothetical protein